MQFAEVILHRRVPSRFESFTYRVPEGMSVSKGQLVEVPFRNQKISGIVRTLHQKTPSYETRLLETNRTLILDERQMSLANWMSEYYAAPFSKVIDFFIPEKIWSPAKKPLPEITSKPTVGLAAAPNQYTALNQNSKKSLTALSEKLLKTPTKKFLFLKSPIDREKFYQSLQSQIPKEQQALFLFPERFFLQRFFPAPDASAVGGSAAGQTRLSADANEAIYQFHGELKESEKAALWEAVRTSALKKIAGTRAALFLPFHNLGLLTLDFEENENYSEKRQPSYRALEVAEKIAELWNIPLIVISSSPRAETWHQAHSKDYEFLEWNEPNATGTRVELLDMQDEKRKGNHTLFAEKTVEKIAQTLAKNQQVLIFVNRKGEASALYCKDCGTIPHCRSCASPMTPHREHQLVCHRCKISEPIPLSCSICGNTRLIPLGVGTEKIESEIKKLFAKARTVRLDKGIFKKGLDSTGTLKALEESDIIVATQLINKPLLLPRLKTCVVIAADRLLEIRDFRTNERTLSLLTHLRDLAQNGTLMIQTLIPEHPLFQKFSQNLIEEFYEDELAVRKSLSLPPFTEK